MTNEIDADEAFLADRCYRFEQRWEGLERVSILVLAMLVPVAWSNAAFANGSTSSFDQIRRDQFRFDVIIDRVRFWKGDASIGSRLSTDRKCGRNLSLIDAAIRLLLPSSKLGRLCKVDTLIELPLHYSSRNGFHVTVAVQIVGASVRTSRVSSSCSMTVGPDIIDDAFPTAIRPSSSVGVIDSNDGSVLICDLEHENCLGGMPELVQFWKCREKLSKRIN